MAFFTCSLRGTIIELLKNILFYQIVLKCFQIFQVGVQHYEKQKSKRTFEKSHF